MKSVISMQRPEVIVSGRGRKEFRMHEAFGLGHEELFGGSLEVF